MGMFIGWGGGACSCVTTHVGDRDQPDVSFLRTPSTLNVETETWNFLDQLG